MRLALLIGLLGVTTFSSTGCGCKPLLPTHVSPGRDITLAPGQTTRIEYSEGGGDCGGDPVPVPMRYLSSDTLVVRVDFLAGNVRAMQRGEAKIWLSYRDLQLDSLWHQVQVDVHVR
jgi:hypothetical protein